MAPNLQLCIIKSRFYITIKNKARIYLNNTIQAYK